MQITTILGLVIGLIAIFGSNFLDGMNFAILIQPSALFIVFGGTVAAILINFSFKSIVDAVRSFRSIVDKKYFNPNVVVEQIVRIAEFKRREGIFAIQDVQELLQNPFLSRGLELVVDNLKPSVAKGMLESEIQKDYEHAIKAAEIFEAAGEYAPTFGIVGTVLGLIQVMQSLEDYSSLGYGVAIAFVATVYGIILANLFFLPFGGKLREHANENLLVKNIILEGVLAIQNDENPVIIENKLLSLLNSSQRAKYTQDQDNIMFEVSADS